MDIYLTPTEFMTYHKDTYINISITSLDIPQQMDSKKCHTYT